MEPPAKRQKLSRHDTSIRAPTRTINLNEFQRLSFSKRNVDKAFLPRSPDVTVSAAVVEVAVNSGSTTIQVTASNGDVPVAVSGMGTLTIPAQGASTSPSTALSASSQSSGSSRSSSSSTSPSSSANNSSRETTISTATSALYPTGNLTLASTTPATSTQRTVTLTDTSTFHVSFHNGTFVIPATTTTASRSRITGSDSSSSVSGDESTTSGGRTRSSSYIFGQDVTDTYLAASTTSVPQGTAYNNNNNPAIAATSTYANPSPTSSDSNGGGGSTGTVLTPQQTQMVGGIVGGVAGIALVLIVLLYVLRWYRQRLKLQGRLPGQLNSGTDRDLGDAALVTMAAPMSQNSRTSLFPTIKKLRPVSGQTFFTDTTSMTGTDSEKGFQRVSGRKIPSVLATGGDQYGGSYGAFEKQFSPSPQAHSFGRSPFQRHQPHNDPNEISFYRDEDASYFSSPSQKSRSAPSSPLYPAVFTRDSIVPRRPSNPNTDRRDFAMEDFNRAFNRNMADLSKPDGFAISRNSPARTPLIQSPSTSTLRLPIQAPVTMDEDVPDLPLPSPGLIVGGSDVGGGGMGLGLAHEVSRQRGLSRFDERGLGSPRFRD